VPRPRRRLLSRRRRSRKSASGAAVAALLLLGLAAIFWQRWRDDGAPEPQTPPQPSPQVLEQAEAGAPPRTAASEASPESAVVAISTEPLPPLEASDTFVRTAAREVSRHPSLARWLAQEDLIRIFVVSVDNIAEGLTPRKHLRFLRPQAKFLVSGSGSNLRIDPSGYRRYDRIADVVSSLDAEGCAELYFRLEPLIQRSYHELGYPGLDFDDRLGQAIAELIAVPFAPEAPALVEEVLRYEFADPDLEALSDAQKHLLRMGPRNVKRIQRKLRELAQAVGLPAGE
jgi:hypothetical protein